MKKYKNSVERKKDKKKLKTALGITVPLVLIIGVFLGLTLPIIISYYDNAYEKAEIVERTDEYIRPEMDEQPSGWEDVTLSEDELGKDIAEEHETLPNSVNQSGNSNSYNSTNSFGNSANAVSVYGKTPIFKVEKKDPDVENILVLGTDSRDVTRERGRSDAIIILSYNKKTDEVKMISVLRDSLVPIEGHGWNRINSAYSFDGVGLAVNTVNQIFDLDIQRFVVVDFNGVKDFINKVGGVDIKLTKAEAEYFNRTGTLGKQVEEGVCHLSGAPALTYMRTRKLDSDFGRTGRQQKMIQALVDKILEEKTLPEIYELTDFAFKLVKTNITLPELTGVISAIAGANKGNKDEDAQDEITGLEGMTESEEMTEYEKDYSAQANISEPTQTQERTDKAAGGGLNIRTQHVPYDGAFSYKRYNGMAIISFDVDDAARRINSFIYG
ncbi:MAG: LCP family protein [Clostridia bacterium]|nr:LCP family protein [Clostridia bacterium]